ncbi:DNA excision repair protein Rad2 [Akanthomyces lecanii RCEF 1005]|uniref:DNA excision repair protein Rad2 n=1 Tax=Akanthomyces lecanii RCEF 1005 TaxID=1081108 RepID=A0A168KHC4_CORDF|nr:DNA excision repair protein Rad2 [Akanthomyces lecanii RCEF 1005]
MGVNGLWTVVQPCARPTNLATLNRKRLAVDASIWIYQFLKAVRDKEGNALRNSHVVGFFRRICKLLWFGIQPVFVFDGGAPALKRATIQKRQRRREGRRDDAVRTAGKLLAVQMQRIAEEDDQKRKRDKERLQATREVAEEPLPDPKDMIYLNEVGMSNQERQHNRKFHKKDAYHLPELDGGIASMGKPDDPRIMSVEELEEYARQFNNGEDVNLYDFSKIDFDGEFFKSLPPPDRYNILNAARLRSRLRLGYSKDQLDDMFPDRMAFSRFQIERVQERNHLTQRLMAEVGMTGTDLTLGVNARVAGEKDREYILVKNEGAEGGWALGVVSKEKDIGEAHKPIDVDAIEIQYQAKEEEDEEDDVDGFEDVPIEGLNRLPKYDPAAVSVEAARDNASSRQQLYDSHKAASNDEEDSLFVGGPAETPAIANDLQEVEHIHAEEEDDLNRAIALSLQNQHGVRESSATEDDLFEDVPVGDKPEWTQKAVEAAKPLTSHGGSMIAHIVNNRANAAVPKRQEKPIETQDSDSDEDMQAIMARARKAKKQTAPATRPILENKKNPFDGPLPFPKLSWGSSLFGKSKTGVASAKETARGTSIAADGEEDNGNIDMAGGFTVEGQDDEPPELPPWLADGSDIRDSLKKQQDAEREINAQDRQDAEEEDRKRRKEMRDRLIEIESDSDDDSDIQIIEVPPSPTPEPVAQEPQTTNIRTEAETPKLGQQVDEPTQGQSTMADSQFSVAVRPVEATQATTPAKDVESPEPEFEDIELPQAAEEAVTPEAEGTGEGTDDVASGIQAQATTAPVTIDDDELFGDADENEYSDPEEEELLVQMAEEAEEHARFATELNQKSMEHNRRDYEQELRQLRTQQKKDRRDADEVTQVMIAECQSLLRLFGIPYITAPMEAEAQCAELVRLGMVDGIVTDDSDTFLFGGTRVYKNMFNSNKFVECYIGNELEKDLSLSRQQLISLAHLLGSDYTEGLPGVGPVTAVEIISEFPGKDGLSDFRAWWDAVQSQARPKAEDASSPFRKKFRRSQAAKLFLPPGFPNLAVDDAYLHPEVDSSNEPFQWGVPDVEGLRQFLMATIGWSKERTDEVLVPVIRDMNKRGVEGTQSNITKFFGGGVGAGAKEAFAPRQTAGASKRMAAAVDRLKKNTAGDESESSQQNSKRQKR